jgi:hypothetical protein
MGARLGVLSWRIMDCLEDWTSDSIVMVLRMPGGKASRRASSTLFLPAMGVATPKAT